MSLIPLSFRDRKALVWGALIAVPAVFFRFGVQPYLDGLKATRDRIATERGVLEREIAVTVDAQQFRDLAARAESILAAEDPRLYRAPDPYAASAALVGYLGEAAGRARVLLQQSDVRGTDQVGSGLVALEVGVRGAGDLEGIIHFVRSLENGPRLVRIERLSIESARGAQALTFTAIMRGYTRQRAEP